MQNLRPTSEPQPTADVATCERMKNKSAPWPPALSLARGEQEREPYPVPGRYRKPRSPAARPQGERADGLHPSARGLDPAAGWLCGGEGRGSKRAVGMSSGLFKTCGLPTPPPPPPPPAAAPRAPMPTTRTLRRRRLTHPRRLPLQLHAGRECQHAEQGQVVGHAGHRAQHRQRVPVPEQRYPRTAAAEEGDHRGQVVPACLRPTHPTPASLTALT